MEHGEFDGVRVGQQEVVRTWKRCAWQHRPRGLQFDEKMCDRSMICERIVISDLTMTKRTVCRVLS